MREVPHSIVIARRAAWVRRCDIGPLSDVAVRIPHPYLPPFLPLSLSLSFSSISLRARARACLYAQRMGRAGWWARG